MLVTRRPFGTKWFEANAADMGVAMLFPISATVRMPVQSFLKPNNWLSAFVDNLLKFSSKLGVIRPSLLRKIYPTRCPF